ncbi:MAG: DNA polymerase III subunit delta [Oscillospiraceae bacterium]|nr:DNA polymerase III subunit delta [Oscillospiraceae bacterium]
MAQIFENDLKRQIKEKNMSNCYLFYGSEDYLKQFYVNRICSKFVTRGSETFSLRRYDGKDNTLDEVLEGAQSMPFMSEYCVVVAHDFPLDTLAADQKKQLSEFLKDTPDTSITVFWMDSITVNPKESKWKSVIDNFTKYAEAVNFEKPSMRELKRIICAYAAKNGCKMEERTAEYLIELSGDSLNVLFNETVKLCNYAGQGGEIKREHIDSIAVRSLEARVFDLSKLILVHNAQGALELLHTLMLQKAEPIDVFGVILMSFADIYRAKTAVSGGENATYPAKLFDYRNKEFRLTNGGRYASKISNEQLRECFDCFAESDRQLKSTAQDGEMILERLIVRLSLILAL